MYVYEYIYIKEQRRQLRDSSRVCVIVLLVNQSGK